MRHYTVANPNRSASPLACCAVVAGLAALAWFAATERVPTEMVPQRDSASHRLAGMENPANGGVHEEPCEAGDAKLPIPVETDLHKRSMKGLSSCSVANCTRGNSPRDEGLSSPGENVSRTPSYIALRRLLL